MDEMEVEYCDESSPAQEKNERGIKRSWLETEEAKKERSVKILFQCGIYPNYTSMTGTLRLFSQVTREGKIATNIVKLVEKHLLMTKVPANFSQLYQKLNVLLTFLQ